MFPEQDTDSSNDTLEKQLALLPVMITCSSRLIVVEREKWMRGHALVYQPEIKSTKMSQLTLAYENM